MSEYGFFSGNPKTEWLCDDSGPDRQMKLLEEFSYTDPAGKKWIAPEGEVINGADIPRPLWAALGSPYASDYRRASIVHDVACRTPEVTRKEADDMFYTACLAGGCSPQQAKLLYAGLRVGGKFLQVSSKVGDQQGVDYTPGASGWPSDAAEALDIYKEVASQIMTKGKDTTLGFIDKIMDKVKPD